MSTDWQIRITKWSTLDDQKIMKTIRKTVFIVEQAVPEELEWDDLDALCQHCLVTTAEEKPVATARLHTAKSTAHIGRMAVLKPYRQKGVGTLMLKTLMEQARKNNVEKIVLNAQTVAIPFYQKTGFVVIGDEFDDAGIPHYKMTMTLDEQHD